MDGSARPGLDRARARLIAVSRRRGPALRISVAYSGACFGAAPARYMNKGGERTQCAQRVISFTFPLLKEYVHFGQIGERGDWWPVSLAQLRAQAPRAHVLRVDDELTVIENA